MRISDWSSDVCSSDLLRPRRPRPIRAAGRSYAPDCPRTHGWPCKSTDHPYNVQMMKFDWDPAKAASNLRKHGVSFEDAQSVFYDEFAVQFYDEPHSSDEERFLLLGMRRNRNTSLLNSEGHT